MFDGGMVESNLQWGVLKMAIRRMVASFIFVVALALSTGAALFWNTGAAARSCTCKYIGVGICIPDPTCVQMDYQIDNDVARQIEKVAHDAGKSAKKRAQDIGTLLQKSERRNAVTHVSILDSGYALLPGAAKEEIGYGLYSYAILTSDSGRSAALLSELFKSFPQIDNLEAKRAQLNILYIPTKNSEISKFADESKKLYGKPVELGTNFARSFYDYKMGRAILNHICNPPADKIKDLCLGDMSRGPYIFTYAKPASSLEPVPPPFLFLDLSDIPENAYGEFIAAFKAQVKREDISDGAKIHSLRLRLLPIVLKAADLVRPVKKAIGDILYSTEDGKKKGKQ
jgi:hypothetical protein